MGYLDAFTASAFLTDSQGRSVFVVSRRRGWAYIVPADAAPRFARLIRVWFAIGMIAIPISAIALGLQATIAVAAVLLLSYYAALANFVRHLERASEIPALTRAEGVRRNMKAMGRRTIGVVAVAGAIFAILGLFVALSTPRAWWAWFVVAYGAAVSVLYIRQWRKFPQMARQPNATI